MQTRRDPFLPGVQELVQSGWEGAEVNLNLISNTDWGTEITMHASRFFFFFDQAERKSNSVLLITLNCSPEGWIVKGTAQMGWAKCISKAPQAAAKWSCMIPEHSTQARCFWLEVDFGEGGKPEYPEKNPQIRLWWTETQPTYDRRCGKPKCRIQCQPDFLRHTAHGHQDGCPSGH